MKPFECKMCGECCYGKGGIKVSDEKVKRISEFFKMDTDSFRSKYCELRNGYLSIATGEDGFCVFFDQKKACLIHKIKPGICFLWPFYEANLNDKFNWELAKEACPGINPDSTFEEFVKQGRE